MHNNESNFCHNIDNTVLKDSLSYPYMYSRGTCNCANKLKVLLPECLAKCKFVHM